MGDDEVGDEVGKIFLVPWKLIDQVDIGDNSLSRLRYWYHWFWQGAPLFNDWSLISRIVYAILVFEMGVKHQFVCVCVSGQQATDSKYLARVRNDGWEKVVFKSGAFGLCVVNWDQEIHANEKYHVWGLTLYNNMLPPSNHRNKERILPKSIGFFSAWLIWPVHCTRTWDAAPHHQGYDIIVRGSLYIYIL